MYLRRAGTRAYLYAARDGERSRPEGWDLPPRRYAGRRRGSGSRGPVHAGDLTSFSLRRTRVVGATTAGRLRSALKPTGPWKPGSAPGRFHASFDASQRSALQAASAPSRVELGSPAPAARRVPVGRRPAGPYDFGRLVLALPRRRYCLCAVVRSAPCQPSPIPQVLLRGIAMPSRDRANCRRRRTHKSRPCRFGQHVNSYALPPSDRVGDHERNSDRGVKGV